MRYFDWLTSRLVLTAVLCCCGSCGDRTAPVSTPSVQLPEARAEAPAFTTSEHREASEYGLIGDAKTDNTSAFQKLLGAGDRTIHVPSGDYVTGALVIPRKTILILDAGVTIRDSGRLGPTDRVVSIRDSKVYISGVGAKVTANRKDYTTGEQRHGIFIYGASNVVIDGLESSGHGGDGFYIGGPPGNPSRDITLRECRASNNRRQGLSITSARRVNVLDGRFDHTRGTPPEYGIDLEPNFPTDPIDRIRIVRPLTEANHGGGILIALGALNTTSERVDVAITDHVSVNEQEPETTVDPSARATIQYNRLR